MNDLFYFFLVFFTVVSLIGGVNWLVTAINSWTDDSVGPTPDLLQEQLKLPENVANVIYVVVFVCTLALLLMVIFPQNLKKAFSTIGGGMKKVM